MTAMDWHLKIAGAALLCLVVLNIFLPRCFRWKEELAVVSLLTRQVFFVHLLFIVITLAMMGTLSLFFTGALMEPNPLSRLVLFGLCLFWFLRLLVQFFGYDSILWRGNPHRTAAHVAATGLWSYLAFVYGAALWQIS